MVAFKKVFSPPPNTNASVLFHFPFHCTSFFLDVAGNRIPPLSPAAPDRPWLTRVTWTSEDGAGRSWGETRRSEAREAGDVDRSRMLICNAVCPRPPRRGSLSLSLQAFVAQHRIFLFCLPPFAAANICSLKFCFYGAPAMQWPLDQNGARCIDSVYRVSSRKPSPPFA